MPRVVFIGQPLRWRQAAATPSQSPPTSPLPVVSPPGESPTSPYTIPTTYINDLPTWLSWLPLTGSMSINLGFESEPSGQMNFTARFSDKQKIICHLSRGARFSIYGIGFRVSNLSLRETMSESTSLPLLEVSVSLGGCHYWMDSEVALIRKNDIDTEDKQNQCRNNKIDKSENQIAEKRSLSWLAGRAGGRFSGITGSILVPNDANPEEGMTPRSAINYFLRMRGCFLDYNDPETVFARKWMQTPRHILSQDQIYSDISSSIAGGSYREMTPIANLNWTQGKNLGDRVELPVLTVRNENTSCIEGVYFIWPKQEITGRFLEDKDKEKSEDTQGNQEANLPKYRLRSRKKETRIEDPDNAASVPPHNSTYDMSVAFWKAGQSFTKEYREIELLDGEVIKERHQVWGFNGPLASQVYFRKPNGAYELQKINLSSFWTVIEDTTTIHHYDNKLFIYTGYTKTGWKIFVYKAEPDINVADIESNPLDQFPTLQIEEGFVEYEGQPVYEQGLSLARRAYAPTSIGVFEQYQIMNEPEKKYYKEAARQPVEEDQICSPYGQLVRVARIDKTWQQPYIVTAWAKANNSLATLDDPRNPVLREIRQKQANVGEKQFPLYPWLTAGQETYEHSIVRILESKNTFNVIGVGIGGDFGQMGIEERLGVSPEDKYVRHTVQAETGGLGDSFRSQVKSRTREEVMGRPEPSKRLPPLWERVPDEDPQDTEQEQSEQENDKQYRYFAYTTSAPTYKSRDLTLVSGSMNFPYARTWGQAKRGVRTTVDIENCKGSYTDSFTCKFYPYYRPGDRLVYYANGEKRDRVILGVRLDIQFQGTTANGKPFNTGTTNLSTGYPVDVPIRFRKDRVPTPAKEEGGQTQAPLEVWLDPVYNDAIGEVRLQHQTRIN